MMGVYSYAFGSKKSIVNVFLSQNIHGMSYGHAHIQIRGKILKIIIFPKYITWFLTKQNVHWIEIKTTPI